MTTRQKRRWWPEITDIVVAQQVGKFTFYVALFIATVTLVFAGRVWDSLMVMALGYGVYRMSRTASVLALVLTMFNTIYKAATGIHGWIVDLFFVAAFTNGVRATFGYHRFMHSQLHVRNIVVKNLLSIGYGIVFTAGLAFAFAFLNESHPNMGHMTLGEALTLGMAAGYIATFKGILPFTKNRPSVEFPEVHNLPQVM
jgi:hypothetical protein